MNSIQGVEIFSVGKWNGDEYTVEHLQQMVDAFEETKQGVRPYLKLGHDPKQKLLQEDGLPAAGWIDKIYIKGEKLVADLVDIPTKVYDLIKTKAYRKVSSEIFWNIKIGEKTYKKMLSAVALLGADTPGVMNLSDILAMYNLKNSFEKIGTGSELELNLFDLPENNKKEFTTMSKTDAELKLEQELAEQKQQAEKVETELKEFKQKDETSKAALEATLKENEELKKKYASAQENEKKLAEEKELAETEKFYTELVSDGLATPAMKEYIVEHCGPEKKEYTAKKLSKKESLKEMLKLFKAGKDVNLDEGSSKGDAKKKDFSKENDDKIKAYMKENGCTYGQAAKALKIKE